MSKAITRLVIEALGWSYACVAIRIAVQAAAGIVLENAPKDSPIPLHPGAERFYKEKGLL